MACAIARVCSVTGMRAYLHVCVSMCVCVRLRACLCASVHKSVLQCIYYGLCTSGTYQSENNILPTLKAIMIRSIVVVPKPGYSRM